MTTATSPTTATPPTRGKGVPWNRQLVPFMAALVGFVFMSFVVIGLYAWSYAEAAMQVARLHTLQDMLGSAAPAAAPSPALAGRVVHVQGTAKVDQAARDDGVGAVFDGALAVRRDMERYRSGRSAGWQMIDVRVLTAPGARVDGWPLSDRLLSRATAPFEPLEAGKDYRLPMGWLASPSEPYGLYQPAKEPAAGADPAERLHDGDKRVGYQAVPLGATSVVARVDAAGRELVPVRINGDDVALIAGGTVDSQTMFAAALSSLNAVRLQATVSAFGFGWAIYIIPALWMPAARRWMLFTLVPMAGIAATLGVSMMAAATAGIAGAFVAGQFAATAYVALIAVLARRANARA